MNFSANSSSVESGGSVTLTWNAPNASICTASGDWSGGKAISGNEIISDIISDQTYTLMCSNATGNTSRSVMVRINRSNQGSTERGDSQLGAIHPFILMFVSAIGLLGTYFRRK